MENLVGYSRRNFLVPIPRVESWVELNLLLRDCCRGYIESHHIRGRDLTVKEAFTLEQRTLIPLPVKPYEAVKIAEGKVDYFATVRFETNRYSVPVSFAGRPVTVKASAFEVKIYHRREEIACHPRSYGKYQTVYDLRHYLPLLERRPRAVKQARPVQQAEIPQELWEYASRLKNPDRGMVRLLRLLVDHGPGRVLAAIKKAAGEGRYSVNVVQYYLTATEPAVPLALPGPIVKPVDLKVYDLLFAGGGTR
ncbi:Mu transposase domain-containing protein [Thermodesulfitimonas autotrophica]|uniref:Mu transposase domain-containing protein n=1 Tax=Thermodesulfitimonas autotrophica TaxID=1894989 RepID=UPI002FE2D4D7